MFGTVITRGIVFCTIVGSSIFLNGCSYLVLSRQTQFIPETEGVTVSISEKEEGPYEIISSKKTKIKLNHFKKQYWVKQEKLAHVTTVEELTRTSSNPLKKLDMAITISSNVVSSIFLPLHLIRGPGSGTNGNQAIATGRTIALYTNLGLGLAAWGAIIPAPSKLYPKKVELPKLVPILTKDTAQLFVTAGRHKFKMNKKGVRVRDYPTMQQYINGYGYESRDTSENFDFLEDIKLYDEIAELLVKAEYGVDSTDAELDKTLQLDSWTKSVVFMTADEKLRCELRTIWALETLDELQYLYDRTLNGNSEWIEFNEEELDTEAQEAIIKQAFVEATDASFKKFLAMDTVQSILSAPVPIPLKEVETLDISTGVNFVSSVSEGVKSVVTIVTPDGFGSGCIISPDGYILTNAHVVDEDTLELEVIMTEDVEKKLPIKFIRMNDAVDLALLKLDTAGLKPMKFATDDQIVTGTDVYAVGTPADVDLGQSITRGIISGKRKFRGHSRIQTDVAISPGNSGGGLITKDGLLLGIVTSAYEGKRINNIGFAIPSPIIESALKIKLKE